MGGDLWPRELRLLQQGSAGCQELAGADHPRLAVVQTLLHLQVQGLRRPNHGHSPGQALLYHAYQRVVVC